jgi:hypothetical protein
VIEVGRRLADCKRRVGHGGWLDWLDKFHSSARTGGNFIDLDINVSALYLLAARRIL